MEGLHYAKDTLSYLQVSQCHDVTDEGLKHLQILYNLEDLTLFNLNGVKNLESCKQFLKSKLVNCKIQNDK